MIAYKKDLPGSLTSWINYTFLTLFGLSTIFPFIYFVVLSFNDGYDAMKGGIYLWPRVFTLNNYLKAFENPQILNSFYVSLFRTITGTLISIFLNAMAAYALTKKNLPGKSIITFYFFFTTLFSGGIIPQFLLYRELGLSNSIWIYVFPFVYNFFNMIIIRTYFSTIPESLAESAFIDGCNDLKIFVKIYLPLSGPVLATVALFFGVAHWNDWFTGIYFASNKKLIPASSLLQQILSAASYESSVSLSKSMAFGVSGHSSTTPESLKMTFLVITTLPIVCIYPFLQKYFVNGVMLGSVKG